MNTIIYNIYYIIVNIIYKISPKNIPFKKFNPRKKARNFRRQFRNQRSPIERIDKENFDRSLEDKSINEHVRRSRLDENRNDKSVRGRT